MLSVTEENRTTRATSRIFAIIAAFPPPWEWPLTAICDHFGLSRRRNRSHPSSGYCSVRYWSSLRSEEHTSELQSRGHLVCRLLLEKKKHNGTETNSSRRDRGIN